jgi:hypothetical protein
MLLSKCIHSITHQSINQSEYDVLILDNTPNTLVSNAVECKALASIHANIRYVTKQTGGLSEARNECMKLTSSELIHFIDDDALVDYQFVQNTLSCFERHTNLSVMGGRVLPDWSLVSRPSWLHDDALGYLSMLDFGDIEICFGEIHGMWLVGANICFKLDTLKKYGGFSNQLGRRGSSRSLLGSEEMKLIYEMKNFEKIVYSPHSVVNHVVPPERMNQSWFIKRVSWQSVSDIMTDTFYMEEPGSWSNDKPGYEFIKEGLSSLITDTTDPTEFLYKLKVAKLLSFWMLNDFSKHGN